MHRFIANQDQSLNKSHGLNNENIEGNINFR